MSEPVRGADETRASSAYESLLHRLQDIAELIGKPPAARVALLKQYRKKALGTPYHAPAIDQSKYTDRLFPYIHNEFLFNSARKIGPLAQVTHLAFAPLYTDRLICDDEDAEGTEPSDKMKVLAPGTDDTLQWLWKHAIHDNFDRSPKHHEPQDFRGGKDDIFEFVRELVDFSEPYITLKRYMLAVKAQARTISSSHAVAETDRYDRDVEESGYSNIGANTVEFTWRATQGRKGHFRWARHDRPYQTFTFTNEYAHTEDEGSKLVPLGSEAWTEALLGAMREERKPDDKHKPFAYTAMDDLPLDVFRNVIGRYVHGANFLVVPLKLLANAPVAPRYAPFAASAPLIDLLVGLAPPEFHKYVTGWREWAERPDASGLWDRPFRALMRSIHENEAVSHRLDALVIGATRDFLIPHCFPVGHEDRFDSEFVGYKCMGGRAYVFTDIRNRPYRMHGDQDGLFSRSVIIDCGLNHYERGRLIQTLTEFATERIMSLLWLARFRLVHHALNVVQTRLSLALSRYQNKQEQPEETLPKFYRDRVGTLGSGSGAQGLISSLEFLSCCLSVLNDVVEGGIMDRAHTSSHSHGMIVDKLGSIREQPLRGYQSLSEFLERRYARPTRTIARVGERYEMLRRRITEIAELVNAQMQAQQSEKQDAGIGKGNLITYMAMILALGAFSHPIGETLKEIFGGDDQKYFIVALMISGVLAFLFFVIYVRFGKPKKAAGRLTRLLRRG